MTRRVLVTGAAGFIGRCSVPALHRLGFDVHAVVAPRSAPGAAALPAELAGATVHAADLLDDAAVGALCDAVRATHLLHFAWIATPGQYWTSAENARWVRASARLTQCFAAAGGRRVVMAGSCAEYDWSRATLCDERTTPLADAAGPAPTAYAAAKLEASRALAAGARRHGLSAAWGRIFFQFGPHEHPSRLVPTVVTRLLAGQPAPCTAGTQVRSFLHVADVGAAFAALLDSDVEGAVNIGSGEPRSVAALVEAIGAQVGRPELIQLGARPMPPGEPALLVPDVARLAAEVGWSPRFSLEAAIADTIAWWRGRA